MSPPSSLFLLLLAAHVYINHLVSWHQITIKCMIAGEIKLNIAQLNTETSGISHFWNVHFTHTCCTLPLPICLPLPTCGSGSQVEIYQSHTRTTLQYSYHFNDSHWWEDIQLCKYAKTDNQLTNLNALIPRPSLWEPSLPGTVSLVHWEDSLILRPSLRQTRLVGG